MANNIRDIKNQQEGLVSIVVTMIFLIVLSLIVVGFAQIARREQRSSLDRQLSSQAFYAAESGINVARSVINDTAPSNDYASIKPVPKDKKDCEPDATGPLAASAYALDGDNTKTTCILIDQTPSQLDWTSVDPTRSTITSIKAYDKDKIKTNFKEITINWQNQTNAGVNQSTGTSLPDFLTWKNADNIAPVLRVELIPVPDGSNIVRQDLVENTLTAFLRPSTGAGAVSTLNMADASGAEKRGALVETKCNPGDVNNKKCSITITNLNSHEYYLRMKTEYNSASVNLTAQYDIAGASQAARIGGAQAEIDATGKAAYVLKRIRVKVPYNVKNFAYPEGVIESGDAVCKKLDLTASSAKSYCTGESTPEVKDDPGEPTITNGIGDAGFSSCSSGKCSGGTSAAPAYRWTYTIYNISENVPGIVASCKWDFGDGTTKTGVPPGKTDACLKGQYLKHTFPKLESPLVCRIYTATLTMKFNNGFSDRKYTSKFYVPNGTKGGPECKAKPGGYKNYP